MNCAEFERHLCESVELRRINDTPELQDHRQQCAACQRAWREALWLDGIIATWKSRLLPIELSAKVAAKLHQESDSVEHVLRPAQVSTSHRSVTTSRRYQQMAALFAAMAVLTLAVVLVQPQQKTERLRHRVTESNPASTSTAEEPVAQDLQTVLQDVDALMADTRMVYAELAGEVSQSIERMTSWETLNVWSSKESVDKNDENERSHSLATELEEGLSPIGQDLGKVYDFFYNTLPLVSPPKS